MSIAIIDHIGQLVTNCAEPNDPDAPISGTGELHVIENASVVTSDGRIVWAGPRASRPPLEWSDLDGQPEVVDVEGRAVLPGFVDSHSHLVFSGDRGAEFEARMAGQPYDGGGILATVEATRQADVNSLAAHTLRLVREARAQGTTTMEIKSGYGLDVSDELKLLEVAAQFTSETTFLGGHAVPAEYRPGVDALGDRDDYVRLVAGPMTDAVAKQGKAKWADVFCEPHSPHAFDGDETRVMLEAAADKGLGLRVHGAQLGTGPGPQLAAGLHAASVDHCTFLTDDDLDALAGAGTVATYLPAVEFSTRQPYPDVRRAIAAGVTIAIASDCNPGTCFSGSIPFAIAIAVREMGLTVAQAVWAATAGGAKALRRDDIGVVRRGARADFAVVAAPEYAHIAYRAGVPITQALDIWSRRSSRLPS